MSRGPKERGAEEHSRRTLRTEANFAGEAGERGVMFAPTRARTRVEPNCGSTQRQRRRRKRGRESKRGQTLSRSLHAENTKIRESPESGVGQSGAQSK